MHAIKTDNCVYQSESSRNCNNNKNNLQLGEKIEEREREMQEDKETSHLKLDIVCVSISP